MVDTNSTHDDVTVAQIHSFLLANTHGWLVTYPHMSVSYNRLATLIHQILTVHTAALRAVNEQLRAELESALEELGFDDA